MTAGRSTGDKLLKEIAVRLCGCLRMSDTVARWFHPEPGAAGPDRFIPIAEATGLIVPLTTAILRHASSRRLASS